MKPPIEGPAPLEENRGPMKKNKVIQKKISREEVAANAYQVIGVLAFGSSIADNIPEDEWIRVLDYFSSIANDEEPAELLPWPIL